MLKFLAETLDRLQGVSACRQAFPRHLLHRLTTLAIFACVAVIVQTLYTPTVNAQGAQSSDKPNVIFILMDDMGYSDISCYGATTVSTPNIDALAKEGLKFTNFHTAASICSPSRAAFLTGAYPQRCGLYMGINRNREAHWFLGLNPDEITIAEQCKRAGYKSLMVGKWHLGHEEKFSPQNQGFDSYYGAPENMGHSKLFYDEKKVIYQKTPLKKLAGLYTAKVVEHIKNHKDQPFFLYFAHNYPHTPYKPSAQFKGSSNSGDRGDVIQEVDWGIGEMLKTLAEEKILDNTIIIFTSDNGATSNQFCWPFRGTKFVSLEGGHRVPFIIYSSRIKQARQVDDFATAMDLFPTISELVGVNLPTDRVYDGISLTPLIDGKKLPRDSDEPFYYYNSENLQAVKKGKWKLHFPRTKAEAPFWDKGNEFFKISKPVLYNIEVDIKERTDVADRYPDVVAELSQLRSQMQSKLGEHMQRGSEQRATGTLFPEVPIRGNLTDWEKLTSKEKGKAKSQFKSDKEGKAKPKKKKKKTAKPNR
ncbi:sulfatase [Mariniblastus sp.]|nr:sulfatase [Mariniblastus sp.]